MTENNESVDVNAYTFKVTLLCNIFASNEEDARRGLDANGAFVSERTVELLSWRDIQKKRPAALSVVKDGDSE